MPYFSYCADDYVNVSIRTDGKAQSNTYCGCELPPKRLYDRDKVYMAFNNSQAANQAGFLFHYRAVGKKCTRVSFIHSIFFFFGGGGGGGV